ncbi:MAG: hypothetical protein RJQ04_03555 [Longimicrobiales bacterium]
MSLSPVLLAGIVAGLALILTAVLTPVIRGAAMAGGLVRGVQADRWHRRPTPAIGGVAIFLGFGLAVGVGYVIDPGATQGFGVRPAHAFLPWTPWEGLVLASAAAFLLGLVDDLVALRPLVKLLGQIAAASLLLLSGIGVWFTGWYAVDAAVSLLWFVGITNAVNLLDNMDGLATGVAAVAGAYLALLFGLEGATGLMILALGFTASLIGFLAHNYPPARIFMGDSGSLFIGLFLAGLALAPAPGLSRSLAAVMAAPVLILGVPILDTTLVTVGRLLERRPVSQGGKDHTSHRFVDLGMTEKRTVWFLWGLAVVGGGIGVLLRQAERGTALLLGGVLIGALSLVGGYLLAARFDRLSEGDSPGLSLYRFVVKSHERYPVFALLLDGVWIVLAYYAAYLIRWDPSELPAELPYFQRTVAVWVGVKLIAFVATGAYGARWPSFGLYDGLRIGRANVVATLLALGVILLVDRVGLSRGVVVIDFMVCALFTVGSRLSFRLLDGTTRRWSESGRATVLLGPAEVLEGAAALVQGLEGTEYRVVALASPEVGRARGRLGAYRLFGGQAALRHAVEDTGAHCVVLVGGPRARADARVALRTFLERGGGVDVFEVDVRLHPVQMDP